MIFHMVVTNMPAVQEHPEVVPPVPEAGRAAVFPVAAVTIETVIIMTVNNMMPTIHG